MKKILLLFGLIGAMICTWSCNNDLDLIDDWKNIPIVYALLSQADDVHYIRVEKAFLDPSTSAFEIAQIPDSIYYDNTVSVEIERVDTGERVTLERVNGADIGFERAEGIFANTPNILYRYNDSDMPLITNKEYRLIITDGNSDQVLTEATTMVVGDFEKLTGQPKNPINWKTGSSITVGWRNEDSEGEADKAAVFFDVRMRIRYSEQNPENLSEFIDKELIWLVEQNVERPYSTNSGGLSPQITTSIGGSKFFEFLAANIDANVGLARIFKNIDIIIDAGGQEIYDYINIGQANTGITSAQAIPTYTNLSTGKGIFSSRNRIVFPEYNIDGEARDSLRDGSITRDLNFQ